MTRRAIDTASAVLSALASGQSHAEVARELGISRQRVGAIVRAAGGRGAPGRKRSESVTTRTARGRALLAELVTAAEAAGLSPEQWLRRAGATDSALRQFTITDLIEARRSGDSKTAWRFVDAAIGEVDEEAVRAVRDVIEAADTYDPRQRAAEKARSRAADEADLASGAKSADDLRRENALFSGADLKIDLRKTGKLY